ncbi:hypothetical protein C4J95_2991 [Pseudomonas orientalis]|uniref:DUF2970 domain-containing protein n=1 Tax=Pseudomonas orientalis TaxID=76758 RepID=UPI000F572CAD|nr:DUF2970 domain-containing protein [Pseudomonas orientalis]AZE83716.1 hypothetical protein C4J98_2303 [Pseudomonas orientalis]AZE94915.1 hypothetical protein C4J96_2799 [Pseudomonas orientalis]AZF00452.1 hypothetical protein C4J95_2991 [Pseudomonas orientalis]
MDDHNDKPPSFWQMLHSVMAAAFGVQSGKNRARDFTHGKPSHFVMLGIAFTAIFALTLFGIVKLVLHLAGV